MIAHHKDVLRSEMRGHVGVVNRIGSRGHVQCGTPRSQPAARDEPVPLPQLRIPHLRKHRIEADGVPVVAIGVEASGKNVPVIGQHERSGRGVPCQPPRGGEGGRGISRRQGLGSRNGQCRESEYNDGRPQSPFCHGAAAGAAERPVRSAGQRRRTEQEEDRPVLDKAPRLERQDEQRQLEHKQ